MESLAILRLITKCSITQAPAQTERRPAPAQAPAAAQQNPQFNEAVLAVKTPSCFVKGVVEQVSDQLLKDTLTSRFGPLKEMDIVRSVSLALYARPRSIMS